VRALTFDDLAVADEFVVPYWARTLPAEDGGIVIDDAVPITFVCH